MFILKFIKSVEMDVFVLNAQIQQGLIRWTVQELFVFGASCIEPSTVHLSTNGHKEYLWQNFSSLSNDRLIYGLLIIFYFELIEFWSFRKVPPIIGLIMIVKNKSVLYEHDEYYDWTQEKELRCSICLTACSRIENTSTQTFVDCRYSGNETHPTIVNNNWIDTAENSCHKTQKRHIYSSAGLQQQTFSDFRAPDDAIDWYCQKVSVFRFNNEHSYAHREDGWFQHESL